LFGIAFLAEIPSLIPSIPSISDGKTENHIDRDDSRGQATTPIGALAGAGIKAWQISF
jgi:hypothetical protein